MNIEEWRKLEKLQNELDVEYDLRRDMLLTRLDVTIQSFQWSDAAKNKSDIIAERYTGKRNELDQLVSRRKATDIVELLAARDDLLHIDKTSSANVRKNTQTDLQKHIIGMVPDRGGKSPNNILVTQIDSCVLLFTLHFIFFKVVPMNIKFRYQKCQHGRKIEAPVVVAIKE